jgi:hypothetical protein
MKKNKATQEVHTPDTKYGMGDHYGTGVRAKIGKMRSDSVGMRVLTPKKLKTPPKSIA